MKNMSFIAINNWAIGLMDRVFTNGLGDWGSIPGQVIPKIQKMVLDAALLNTQHYKAWIKGKGEQSREMSSALPYTSVYWKGSLQVVLDYSCQFYLLIAITYIRATEGSTNKKNCVVILEQKRLGFF